MGRDLLRQAIYNREWLERHPEARQERAMRRRGERNRRTNLWYRYHLTLEDFDQRLIDQRGLCAFCGHQLRSRIVVDHDHKTGRVRGLVHSGCNAVLGFAEKYLPAYLAANP